MVPTSLSRPLLPPPRVSPHPRVGVRFGNSPDTPPPSPPPPAVQDTAADLLTEATHPREALSKGVLGKISAWHGRLSERVPPKFRWVLRVSEALLAAAVAHAAIILENVYYDNVLRPIVVRPGVNRINHVMTSPYLNPDTYAAQGDEAKMTLPPPVRNALFEITSTLPNPWLYSGYQLQA